MTSDPLQFPRIKQVIVTVETEDGRINTITSQPGLLNQQEGVRIDTDRSFGDSITGPVDVAQRTTVSWVENWTEYLR